MTAGLARLAVAGALLSTLPLAACTGGSGHGSTGAKGTAAAGAVSTRWWAEGSDYCAVLRDTVRAGRSILPGVGADDPARLASTKAFVAELEHAAPAPVAGAWRVLGPAVVKIVASGGDLKAVRGVDAAAVQRAATTVATHAERSCHVDVSATAS